MRSLHKMIVAVLAAVAAAMAAAGPVSAGELPQVVTLDSLAEYFEGVTFDHAMHVEAADNCGVCHHHTTGGPAEPQCAGCHQVSRSTTVACQSCHPAQPFSAAYLREREEDLRRFHVDKPGLKAAYHRNCMGCHEEVGGPTGCEGCHVRTDAGAALYRTGAYAPRPAAAADSGH